ncbi:MAG: hypothetical protein RIT04_388 [Candidatus Parcubacteria bacterium]|jgi:gas vesicle protein
METLIKADIFFFITSIAVVIVTIVLAIAGFYFIRVLRTFGQISEKLKDTVDSTSDDIRDIVEQVQDSSAFRLMFGGGRRHRAAKHTIKK